MDKLNKIRLYLATLLTAISVTVFKELNSIIKIEGSTSIALTAVAGVYLSLIVTPVLIRLITKL